ncbi:unnamed protein product, partial [Staurois parvus]
LKKLSLKHRFLEVCFLVNCIWSVTHNKKCRTEDTLTAIDWILTKEVGG